MNDIKLFHGDCLDVIDKLIEQGVKVDAIITDPPYGTTACKWDYVIPFTYHIIVKNKILYLQDALLAGFSIDFFETNKKAGMWERLNKLIKDNGAIVLFGSEPFSSYLRMSNIKNYKYDWIWDKVNSGSFATAKIKPLPVFENISIFGGSKINYFPIMEDALEKNMRSRKSVYIRKEGNSQGMASGIFKTSENHNEKLRFPKNKLVFNKNIGELNAVNRLHPTQKPVPLLEYLIKTYTNENETVLDFTMGSGTTGVACINANRKFIGIEKDEKYFEIAKKRIEGHKKDE